MNNKEQQQATISQINLRLKKTKISKNMPEVLIKNSKEVAPRI